MTETEQIARARLAFRDLHLPGVETFVLPNPWDVGSARILEHLGFKALATTSSGLAATFGRPDGSVTLDELVAHVSAVTSAVSIPVNVDAERLYGDTPQAVAEAVDQLAAAGASGVSIEDWDPVAACVDPVATATKRVATAAEACRRHGIVLTGRAENLIHGVNDLDDTINRLRAYRDAGAACAYAPGLSTAQDIARVVQEVGIPVNVLMRPGAPTVPELAALGVRRVSTGGSLAWAAYGALVESARELAGPGTSGYLAKGLPSEVRSQSFSARV